MLLLDLLGILLVCFLRLRGACPSAAVLWGPALHTNDVPPDDVPLSTDRSIHRLLFLMMHLTHWP
jgi:hypothetical protein